MDIARRLANLLAKKMLIENITPLRQRKTGYDEWLRVKGLKKISTSRHSKEYMPFAKGESLILKVVDVWQSYFVEFTPSKFLWSEA